MSLSRETPGHSFGGVRGPAVTDDNVHSLVCEGGADARTDASRAARDHCHGLLERRFHRLSHLFAVPAHAEIGLLLVRGKSFQRTQPRTILSHQRCGFIGQDALIGAGLDEFAHP
jgi:hypothetical protein